MTEQEEYKKAFEGLNPEKEITVESLIRRKKQIRRERSR